MIERSRRWVIAGGVAATVALPGGALAGHPGRAGALWATRAYVHFDRTASPWLIRLFIDPEAQFVFVPWGREADAPSDAIRFSIPSAELGPHDAAGTTFDKLVRKYTIEAQHPEGGAT